VTARSLEDLLREHDDTVTLLRNAQAGPNPYPGVPSEFTNWRDEQLAWQNTCVLLNLSYHMTDLAVRGPDALKLLSALGVNSFGNFAINKAKQFVPCTPDGHVIGDVILFYLAENEFNLVGRPPVLNWVTYHAQTGGYDVEVELDQRWASRTDNRRRSYRFQLQGPNAMQVTEKLLGQQAPELKLFNMTAVNIGGLQVRALRHGMVGQPGWELFGPWEDEAAVREAIVSAGAEFGLRQVGGRAYSTTAIESGWIATPLPAIYSDAALREYRQWLPATGYEALASIGGSFNADAVEDYYFTPWDLGYGHLVKFDHDFIGRDALQAMANDEHRSKVTLALDAHDVARTIATMFTETDRAKFMDWPSAFYSMHPYDKVCVNDAIVGVSTLISYTANEGKLLTLAVLDAASAEPGTEVTLVWGEEGGGTAKPTVERHVQTEINAIVSPVPYVASVRAAYAPEGWRKA
jgi:glycine cleavage system aminomethyltransferase T